MRESSSSAPPTTVTCSSGEDRPRTWRPGVDGIARDLNGSGGAQSPAAMAPNATPGGGSSFPILDPPEREGWLRWLRSTFAGLGPGRMIGATLSLAALAALVSVLWFQPTASGSFGVPPAPTSTATPSALPTLLPLSDPASASLAPVAQATAPSSAITGDGTPRAIPRPSSKSTPKPTSKPTATPTPTPKPTPSPSTSASPSSPGCSPLIPPCPSPSS